MSKTYKLRSIHDLLLVPADRRKDCLLELEAALLLHELAFADRAHATEVRDYEWTDDGDRSTTISTTKGDPLITMRVSKWEPESEGGAAGVERE